MKREEIFEYVKKQYGTIPEYLWKSSPENAILRHKNGKWYAAILRVEKSKLGLEEEGMVDVINVKCEPDMVGLLTQTYGFLPGYHMNKKYWITMLLDGTVSEAKILDFLDLSYDLIDGKRYRNFIMEDKEQILRNPCYCFSRQYHGFLYQGNIR